MTNKLCYTCREVKELTDFNKSKCRKDGLNSICRDCSKARSKRYYRENRAHHKKVTLERGKKQKERNRRFVFDYLCEHPCIDCGEADPIVLEFDHLPEHGKSMDISRMVFTGYSIESIKTEIKRCDVVCANCHKKRTSIRGNHYRYRMLQEKTS
jgi:hypothetical protein